MFTVVLPSAVAPATQYAGRAPQFAPGQIVEAVVLALLKDGAVRIAIGDLALDVKSEIPLQPGSTLRLAVKGSEHAIKLVPIPGSVRAPTGGAVNAISQDAMRANAVSSREYRPALAGGSASAATPMATQPPDRRPEPLVRIDMAQPAPHGTPASLTSSHERGAARNAAPGSVAAGEALASLVTSAPKQVIPNVADGEGAPVQIALAAGIRGAAARQSGLAPLFSNVEALLAQTTPWPEPLRQAALDLLRLRIPADSPVTSENIRSAFARSGLFLEAQLAVAGESAAPALAPDLKRALLILRETLRSWLGAQKGPSDPPTVHPHRAPDFDATNRQPERPPLGVPPPYRGAPTTAQPAVAATIADWPAPKAAEHLVLLTEGALARQTLLQAASLPERNDAHTESSASRWVLEMPIVSLQGTSIAQCEISRDGRSQAEGDQVPVWRARFSVNVEPIGPVHGQIALLGERAAVTLWAERPEAAEEMRERTALLAQALQDAELDPDIHIRMGAPRRPQSAHAAGRFLDQAS